MLSEGGSIVQETRLYDSAKNETRSMRSKENANDYRYFPDPDLLPVVISQTWIDEIAATLPELPWQKRERLQKDYGLSEYDANVLTSNKALGDYFEAALEKTKASPKITANWVMGELSALLNKHNLSIETSPISALALGELLSHLADNTISGKIAKTVFEKMWETGESASIIIDREGLVQENDSATLEKVIDEIIQANPAQLAEYRSGKDRVFGYFVGQVMKHTGGKANPAQVNELLKKKLA